MKSIVNLHHLPRALPVLAEELVEFHAARILLLLSICGDKGRINGLTKMAKLDFFVRYPKFFSMACAFIDGTKPKVTSNVVESKMIRYHYGPWDQRYYHILAYLESRHLVTIEKRNVSRV